MIPQTMINTYARYTQNVSGCIFFMIGGQIATKIQSTDRLIRDIGPRQDHQKANVSSTLLTSFPYSRRSRR